MIPQKKNQINYALKSTELMLYYSYSKRKKISIKKILNNECDILRKTSLYNFKRKKIFTKKEKKWKKILQKIEIFSQYSKTYFVKKSLKILKPYLLERIKKKQSLVEYNTSANFGCFDFSIKDSKIDLHMPVFRFISPEIKNYKSFSKKKKLSLRAKDLYKLLIFTKKKYPKFKVVQMGSWMNQFKPFKELFPKNWKPNGKEKNKNSIAWWGQFLKSDGDINYHLYQNFKKNLKFRYTGSFYQCRRDEIINHLEKIYEK